MFERFDEKTANAQDRVAWALCQIIDDDAPMRWTRYRFAAECIATNTKVMDDLRILNTQKARSQNSERLPLEPLHDMIKECCKLIPDDWEIRLCVERGAAWVELYNNGTIVNDLPDMADKTLIEILNDAVCYATSNK